LDYHNPIPEVVFTVTEELEVELSSVNGKVYITPYLNGDITQSVIFCDTDNLCNIIGQHGMISYGLQ